MKQRQVCFGAGNSNFISEDLNDSFVGQFVTKILNNLQITVQNLHLRYEDTGSNKNPFAFGITLDELNIYSTDPNWRQTFLTEEQAKQKIIYKVLKNTLKYLYLVI